MTHFLFLILVFLGIAVYFMTPDERIRLLRIIVAALRKVKEVVTLEGLQSGEFFNALCARTPRVVATPALIALSAITPHISTLLQESLDMCGPSTRFCRSMFVPRKARTFLRCPLHDLHFGHVIARRLGRYTAVDRRFVEPRSEACERASREQLLERGP